MKVKVVKEFIDVNTGKKYKPGEEITISKERKEEIEKNTKKLIDEGKLQKDDVLIEIVKEENKKEENK